MPTENENEEVQNCACDWCREEVPEDTMESVNDGDTICSRCADNSLTCDWCEHVGHRHDFYDCQGDSICESCYNSDTFTCDDCGERFHNDRYVEDGYCDNCHGNRVEEGGWSSRKPDIKTNEHISENPGKIISTPRIWSFEIECLAEEPSDIRRVINEVEWIGAVDDGSISGDGEGVEFVSPRIAGELSEKRLVELCKALTDRSFYVNSSCGLHIHIDGAGFADEINGDHNKEPKKLKALMLFYYYFDRVLLKCLPLSRRDNSYCMHVSQNYQVGEIMKAKTIDDFEILWYKESSKFSRDSRKKEKYDSSRYTGLNLHVLLGQGHGEVRYHSGSLNATKILYWAELHTFIWESVASGKINKKDVLGVVDEYNKTIRRDDKGLLVKFLDLLVMRGLSERVKEFYLSRYDVFNKAKDETESEKESSLLVFNPIAEYNRATEVIEYIERVGLDKNESYCSVPILGDILLSDNLRDDEKKTIYDWGVKTFLKMLESELKQPGALFKNGAVSSDDFMNNFDFNLFNTFYYSYTIRLVYINIIKIIKEKNICVE